MTLTYDTTIAKEHETRRKAERCASVGELLAREQAGNKVRLIYSYRHRGRK
jgi:hypothetical protein